MDVTLDDACEGVGRVAIPGVGGNPAATSPAPRLRGVSGGRGGRSGGGRAARRRRQRWSTGCPGSRRRSASTTVVTSRMRSPRRDSRRRPRPRGDQGSTSSGRPRRRRDRARRRAGVSAPGSGPRPAGPHPGVGRSKPMWGMHRQTSRATAPERHVTSDTLATPRRRRASRSSRDGPARVEHLVLGDDYARAGSPLSIVPGPRSISPPSRPPRRGGSESTPGPASVARTTARRPARLRRRRTAVDRLEQRPRRRPFDGVGRRPLGQGPDLDRGDVPGRGGRRGCRRPRVASRVRVHAVASVRTSSSAACTRHGVVERLVVVGIVGAKNRPPRPAGRGRTPGGPAARRRAGRARATRSRTPGVDDRGARSRQPARARRAARRPFVRGPGAPGRRGRPRAPAPASSARVHARDQRALDEQIVGGRSRSAGRRRLWVDEVRAIGEADDQVRVVGVATQDRGQVVAASASAGATDLAPAVPGRGRRPRQPARCEDAADDYGLVAPTSAAYAARQSTTP